MATEAGVDVGADVEIVGLRCAGFTTVDLIDGWLPLPDRTRTELADLGAVLTELGGDALWMPERGRIYLERLIEDLRGAWIGSAT